MGAGAVVWRNRARFEDERDVAAGRALCSAIHSILSPPQRCCGVVIMVLVGPPCWPSFRRLSPSLAWRLHFVHPTRAPS